MHGYSAHAYKWINKEGEFHYVQVHLLTDQGIKNLNNKEAHALEAEDPDHAGRGLYESIEGGESPSWTIYVQEMTTEQAEQADISVFDLTKTWSQKEYPLRRVAKLVLERNSENYFAEVEQSAFSPANTVPGIEPSADPVLQARLFSYADTQRYRLGPNFNQLPVNRPLQAYCPFQRDGPGRTDGNYGVVPYYPTPFEALNYRADASNNEAHEKWVGEATSFHLGAIEKDYEQPRIFWELIIQENLPTGFLHS